MTESSLNFLKRQHIVVQLTVHRCRRLHMPVVGQGQPGTPVAYLQQAGLQSGEVSSAPRVPGGPTSRNTSAPICARVFIAAVSDNVIPAFFVFVLRGAESARPRFGCSEGPVGAAPTGKRVRAWRPVVDRRRCTGSGAVPRTHRTHAAGTFAKGAGRRAFGEFIEEKAFARLRRYGI